MVRAGSGTSNDTEQLITFTRGNASDVAGLVFRYTDNNNWYFVDLGEYTSNIALSKLVGGSFTSGVAFGPTTTFNLNTAYKLRVRNIGTNIKARCWLASNSEPSTWDIDVTDTSLSSGGYGVVLDPGSASAQTFDDYTATDGSTTTTSTRTIPATAALLATSTRTISDTAALLATNTRTIPTTAALLATSTRTIGATAALIETQTRTIGTSAALELTSTRTTPATAALIETQARTVPTTAALIETFSRSVPMTAALQSTNTRTIPATAALLAQRIIPCTAVLSGVSVAPATNATFYVRGGQAIFYVRKGNATFYVRDK